MDENWLHKEVYVIILKICTCKGKHKCCLAYANLKRRVHSLALNNYMVYYFLQILCMVEKLMNNHSKITFFAHGKFKHHIIGANGNTLLLFAFQLAKKQHSPKFLTSIFVFCLFKILFSILSQKFER